MSTIPEYRRPPKNPAVAIAQSRNWFLFDLNGEPMAFRRKPIWFTPLGTNVREFVGDDFEPMGHMFSAKMPDGVKTLFESAWSDHAKPPLCLETAP